MIHTVHDQVLRFINDRATAAFESLALAVFAHQFESIPVYRRFCEQRGQTPSTVHDWREIPPVPTLAFKHLELRCGPSERTFVTTGTTQGTEHRGRHAMPDLRLYHAAAVAGLKEFVFPDVDAIRILSLIPSAAARPESSLGQMVDWAVEDFGCAGSGFYAEAAQVDVTGFIEALRCSEREGTPVCIMTTTGTLLGFLHRSREAGWSFRLPHGSRLMDSGGSKGGPRPMSRNGLMQAVWSILAIPSYFVVNEYGMTELSSQYYDNVIRDRYRGYPSHRAKVGPHWLRPIIVDPATLCEVLPGTRGLLTHVDLANAGTAVAVLTEDVGCASRDGLELIGRAKGAEARGCSLALADFAT
ncbi:MAG: long-chain fatty acid--CoA ligase [Candidatus Binatia bacterium]